MSKNLNSIVSKGNDLGKNFITLFVFTSIISFFVLISLYSGLTYYWRKFSIDELKQEMLEEEEAQSDLRKLEVEVMI